MSFWRLFFARRIQNAADNVQEHGIPRPPFWERVTAILRRLGTNTGNEGDDNGER